MNRLVYTRILSARIYAYIPIRVRGAARDEMPFDDDDSFTRTYYCLLRTASSARSELMKSSSAIQSESNQTKDNERLEELITFSMTCAKRLFVSPFQWDVRIVWVEPELRLLCKINR